MAFKYKQSNNNKNNVYYLLLVSYKEPKILDLKIYTWFSNKFLSEQQHEPITQNTAWLVAGQP